MKDSIADAINEIMSACDPAGELRINALRVNGKLVHRDYRWLTETGRTVLTARLHSAGWGNAIHMGAECWGGLRGWWLNVREDKLLR